ncbi:MAG TPA: hypothetical protein VN723_07610 [Rhizomicrobium sp.]|jgi:hypothetical protein|nr:hypothetical protein [Rhizomicrobium sp.]
MGIAMRFCARIFSFISTAWLAILAGAHAAQAQDCKPLQLINSIKLESYGSGKGFLVPVEINGVPQKLVLDTGGGTTRFLHKP